MKVFYMLLLTGLLAVPAYAEDDVFSATETEDIAVPAAEPAEKEDLLQVTAAEENTEAEKEADTSEAAETTDLLQATAATDESAEAAEKTAELLPEDFKNNLVTCTPSSTMRMVDNRAENIEIIGAEDDKCKIKLTVFHLSIPMADLPQIATYEDLEKLCKNSEVSTLSYTDNYNYANLMSELNQCKGYQYLHHNGRASTEYPFVNVTVVTDMTAQNKEDICELTFVNEVTVDNKFLNFSVICEVPDEKIAPMLEPYRDLIDLYGAKEIVNADGSVSSRTAVSNDKTQHVDARLMYELQTAGYCRLLEEAKQ